MVLLGLLIYAFYRMSTFAALGVHMSPPLSTSCAIDVDPSLPLDCTYCCLGL